MMPVFVAWWSLWGVPTVHAIYSSGGSVRINNPIGCSTANCVVTKITGILASIAIPIVVIMVLYGGFQMMTAGGDPEKFKTGRKTILYAAVGLVVVLLADSIARIIQNTFK